MSADPERSGPPRLARWWLERTLPRAFRDEVIGDLHEVYTRRRVRQGSSAAGLWYARQAAASSMRFVLERFRSRAMAGGEPLSALRVSRLDFVLGTRMLVKYSGLTVVGGLAMATAIAVGAIGFEAISQLASPVLPFDEGDRVVAIRNWNVAENGADRSGLEDYVAWRDQVQSITDVGAYRVVERNLIIEGRGAEPVKLAEVSASVFTLTRVDALLGRTLVAEDESPGAPLVVVLGQDVWQSRFDADPGVLGRTVRVGTDEATVVGVMPDDFRFPVSQNAWVPLRGDDGTVSVVGRLADGVTMAQAQAELTTIGARMAAASPETHQHLRPRVLSYTYQFFPIEFNNLLRAGIYSSNVVFLLFLALVCGNIAALVFARTATRESEIVVRSALGASRGRILTQLFAESLVLSLVAAAVGLAVAAYAYRWGMAFLDAHVFNSGIPFWFTPSLSVKTLLYAGGLTVLGALIAGVVPALRMTRGTGTRLRQLAAGGGGVKFGGFWTTVLVGQMAVTIIFIGISVYTVVRGTQMRTLDVGFAAENYLSARLTLDRQSTAGSEMSDAGFRDRFRTAYGELERRLLAEPGVNSVTFATVLPGSYHSRVAIQLQDEAASRDDETAHRIQRSSVEPGFFDEIGVPMVSGRGFTAADIESDAPVLIVNPSFVHHILQGRNPIGQRLRFQVSEDPENPWGPWHEIIGVVREIAMTNDPELPHSAGVYMPLAPAYLGETDWANRASSVHVVVHTRTDPQQMEPRLRQLAAAVDPTLRLYAIMPLSEVVRNDLPVYWFWLRVLALVSALGLLLALAAIYSVMSYTVSRRTREIGIRIALGADPRRIVTATLARPMAQAALGVFVGVGLLVLAAGGIRSLRLAAIILGFTSIMLLVVTIACIIPVRRALSIEPTEALKAE